MKKTSNHTRLTKTACRTLVLHTISYQTVVKHFYIPTRVSTELKPHNTAFYKGE